MISLIGVLHLGHYTAITVDFMRACLYSKRSMYNLKWTVLDGFTPIFKEHVSASHTNAWVSFMSTEFECD